MEDYKKRFIELAIEQQVLAFGDFTLKSGRKSPYFFNFGRFCTGDSLREVGFCYAKHIMSQGIDFDLLFGPAYKGIPLVGATAVALSEHFDRNVRYAFNRKEAKGHGEGGHFVGAPIEGKTLILDDLVTAGTATRETAALLAPTQAEPTALLVAMDRQEKGVSGQSPLVELSSEFGIETHSVISLNEVLDFLTATQMIDDKQLNRMREYQEEYAVA